MQHCTEDEKKKIMEYEEKSLDDLFLLADMHESELSALAYENQVKLDAISSRYNKNILNKMIQYKKKNK
jgi:hypothetical protein